MTNDKDGAQISRKRVRSRTGCLPCRKKRKKCDERKPSCARCMKSSAQCRWDSSCHFRLENALTVTGFDRTQHSRPALGQVQRAVSDRSLDTLDNDGSIVETNTTELNGDTSTGVNISTHLSNASPSQTKLSYNSSSAVGNTGGTQPYQQAQERQTLINQNADHLPSPETYCNSQTQSILSAIPAQNHQQQPNLPLSSTIFLGATTDTSPGLSADGIFEPGSRYEELHQTLRAQILQAAQSAQSSRRQSQADIEAAATPDVNEVSGSQTPPELSRAEELILWENWVNEISTWLDKFSHEKYFQHVLPVMAHDTPHLKYAMLALSARQLERKNGSITASMSLCLYHWAIHLLLPQLHTRATSVLASCVILCVLEMFSCAPKAWRRHLDGCAGLIQSMGIHIDCGGLEEALFICFARMDVWCGLISSGHTLISVDKWTSNATFEEDMRMYKTSTKFEDQAKYICYLLARVLNLTNANISSQAWADLFAEIEEWYASRPVPMQAVLSLPQQENDTTNPFPSVMFSNDAAISGNQLYHTAAILMLQYKPPRLRLPKPNASKSMLWHARQICAISLTNKSNPAWTNAIQPIWIAGQLMSHPSEHRAIVDLYERIERETGWGAAWRAEDLREHWGDLS